MSFPLNKIHRCYLKQFYKFTIRTFSHGFVTHKKSTTRTFNFVLYEYCDIEYVKASVCPCK